MVVFIEEYFYRILFVSVCTGLAQNWVGDFCQNIEVVFIPEHLCRSGCTIAHAEGVDINGRSIFPNGINRSINGRCAIGSRCRLGLCFQCHNTAGWLRNRCHIKDILFNEIQVVPRIEIVKMNIFISAICFLYISSHIAFCNQIQINDASGFSGQRNRNVHAILAIKIRYRFQQFALLVGRAAIYGKTTQSWVKVGNPNHQAICIPSSLECHITCRSVSVCTQSLQGLRGLNRKCLL